MKNHPVVNHPQIHVPTKWLEIIYGCYVKKLLVWKNIFSIYHMIYYTERYIYMLAIKLWFPNPGPCSARHLSRSRIGVARALEAQNPVLPAVADQQRPVHVQRHCEGTLEPRFPAASAASAASDDLPGGAAGAPGAANHAVVLGAVTRGPPSIAKLAKLINHGLWGNMRPPSWI